MKFSIFYNFGAIGRWHEYHQVVREAVEVARLADESGFWSIWYPEQHFRFDGYEASPNAVLLSAWCAAHTKRIRVGQAANILPQWHPLRLAEDIAMLDHMTGGRVEVGIGRGFAYEAINLNRYADVRNREQNRAVFEETLDILLKAWTNDFFSHEGTFYLYPVPGVKWDYGSLAAPPELVDENGEIRRLAVRPQPLQKPHPPLWQVVDSERSIRGAASRGLSAITWLPPVSALRPRFEAYREAAAQASGRDFSLGEGLALLRDTYVADSMSRARRESEEAIMGTFKWILGKRGLGNLQEPGEVLPENTELTFDLVHPRNLLVGTPSYVVEKIHELREVLGLQHLFIWSSHFGMPHDRVLRSLELFATEVMPNFDSEGPNPEG